MLKKIIVLAFILALLFLSIRLDLFTTLNLTYLQGHLEELRSSYAQDTVSFLLKYMAVYILVTALSLPGGATLLTLLGGAVMSFSSALFCVAFASTAGATLAFWASRFLLRDWVEKKFSQQARLAQEEVKQNGWTYLLTLRLMPIFPFFLVNIILGLTGLSSSVFFVGSFLGMIPGIAVYVLAGKSFATLHSPKDILSFKILLLLTLLGLLPLFLNGIAEMMMKIYLYRRFKKPSSFDYNTLIIGGGSAGLVSAYLSSALKAKVAIIEKHLMGGDCLNTGCVPSKTLIRASKESMDFSSAMELVRNVQREIAPHDSKERYQSLGVDVYEGEALVLSPWEVQVGQKRLTAKKLIIATGARPRLPDIPGLGLIPHYTSENIWSLTSLPSKLLVIGGGPIGCELAQAFHRLGSKVIILESGRELLSKEDTDVSAILLKQFMNEGLDVCFQTQALRFEKRGERSFLHALSSGQEQVYEFDACLIAIGREANTRGFGLEKLGLAMNPNGTIKTNAFMQTSLPNIFSCGDVTGPYQLTHMAGFQAKVASLNSLLGSFKMSKARSDCVSWCTFTEPEIATVGLNEKMCREKGIDYEVTCFPFSDLDRALIEGASEGMMKVLTRQGTDKILGASIAGTEASHLIMHFVLAIQFKKGMRDLLQTIHPYPMRSEAIRYVAGEWQKNHTPSWILSLLESYFSWRRR